MSCNVIGETIARLRRGKGITQEQLAKHTQVTTQAVSKWENGGVPDTDLLPAIADFFGVSIDALFGRDSCDFGSIEMMLSKIIADSALEDRFHIAFELCWAIERALFGDARLKGGSIEETQAEVGDDCLLYSSIRSDFGFTLMGLSKRLPYFLLAPECPDKDLAYFRDVDYISFFRDLADKAVFDTLVLLSAREAGKAFTPNLVANKLSISADKAKEAIQALCKYGIIRTTQIEMDDIIQEVYNFDPTPSFVALLIFAREMIKRPNRFCFYSGGRNKPLL